MILHDERNRLGFAISGAVIIHTMLFVAMQLGVHWPSNPPEAAPIYVELNAPEQPPQTVVAAAPQPVPASAPTAPASAPTAPASAPTAPASAPREYDPLAQAPTAADLGRLLQPSAVQPAETPRTSDRSSPGNAASGPTPQENLFSASQARGAEQFREQHPVESGSVEPPAVSQGTGTGKPAAPSTDALGGKIASTMRSIADAGSSPSNSGSSSANAASSSPDSVPASSAYSDSRLKFAPGVARSLLYQGRLNLDQDLVDSILREWSNHPAEIVVTVTFTVTEDGFVSNLQLPNRSGYTRLDQMIERVFNGQVFKPAPGSPPAEGKMTYKFQTSSAR